MSDLIALAKLVGTIVIGAVASLGFVAFVGAVILWSRFEAAELPADTAVALQRREDLVTVGGIALVLFCIGGLLAVLLLRALDKGGTASLRTRNGLLAVMLLEILAAFVVEEWDGVFHWLLLGAVVLVGLAGVGGFLELTARSLARARTNRLRLFLVRAREIFFKRVPEVSRTRLWAGLVVLVAAVAAIAAVDPKVPRYGLGAALFAGGAAILLVNTRDRHAERTWGLLMICLVAVVGAGAVLAHESPWVAAVALISLVLVGMNIAVAHVTGPDFVWYGVCVFVSIALFGAAFSLVRALEDPQAQGIALLRANDTSPVCGIYVGETDDRLYYGRVDLQGTGNVRDLRADSGRLLWVPRERLVASEIGPLEPIDAAQSTALDLRQEIAIDREPSALGDATAREAEIRLPRPATGADPCGPRPTNVEQKATRQRAMAERFQPRLLMSESDGFWPVSLLTIFDLKRRGEVLCREPGCVPVRSQADLPFVGGETQWLEYPGPYDSKAQQRRQVIRALGTEDPYRSAREYFLMTEGDSKTKSLQYWFFYPFNYQPLRTVGINAGYHEGDFEHVDVLVSRDGEPRMVWMARHDDEGQGFLWTERTLKTHGTHVDIYPAKGSHASYESCLNKARPKAPFGLINDRPECEGTKQIVLEPGQVPLHDLSRAGWACWAGRFGHITGTTSNEWKYYEANGPASPLWQQRGRGKGGMKPCEGELPASPDGLVSTGEEPLGDPIANTITARADRLDPHFDECDDWRRPQPQGAYLMACHPKGLAQWMSDGLPATARPRLRIAAAKQAPDPQAWPVAVRRDARAPSFDGWRIRSEQRALITVYAACIANRRPIEVTFNHVAIAPGRELRIDTRTEGRWRLMAEGEDPVTAAPRFPDEADGPNRPTGRVPPSTICSEKDTR